jgi:hypothetical protein
MRNGLADHICPIIVGRSRLADNEKKHNLDSLILGRIREKSQTEIDLSRELVWAPCFDDVIPKPRAFISGARNLAPITSTLGLTVLGIRHGRKKLKEMVYTSDLKRMMHSIADADQVEPAALLLMAHVSTNQRADTRGIHVWDAVEVDNQNGGTA